jgi:hypothetical protein
MDLAVQIRAFVDRAKTNGGAAYLRTIRDQAMDAVAAGDIEVTTLSFEGASAGGSRKFNAQQLLEVAQHALEEIEGNEEARTVTIDYSLRRVST